MFKSVANSIRHYIRGGQLFNHNWSMAKQVLVLTIAMSILGGAAFVGATLYKNYDPYIVKLYKVKMKSELLDTINRGDKLVTLPFRSRGSLALPAKEFLKSKYVLEELDSMHKWFSLEKSFSLITGIIAVILVIILIFYLKGKDHMKEELLEGNTLEPVKKIAKKLDKSGKASDCVIDGLPLVKDTETQHIGMIGTTGTGKSVLIKKLITHACNKGQPGIIYDKTGELTEQFYQPERGDKLLNPFDLRMPAWDLWSDCMNAPDFDSMAANIIASTHGDTFWSDGARVIFSALAREYGRHTAQPNMPGFLKLLYSDLTKLDLLQNTEAAPIINSKADKTTGSFLNILTVNTKSLRYLPTEGEAFSIRNWIENGEGFLFLTSRQDIHESVKSLFSCWINTTINALMCLPPSRDRRFWFFIDELPSLQAIPSIGSMLAEGRKFGACGALGFQSIAQIEHIYGTARSQSIAALLNTQFYFRQSNAVMSEWASRNIGEATYLESHEGVSYGANTVRDGVSINKQEKVRRIATAQTMSSLPDLSCYVRLAGNYPIAKHKLSLEQYMSKCHPYNMKDQLEAPVEGALEIKASQDTSESKNAKVHESKCDKEKKTIKSKTKFR